MYQHEELQVRILVVWVQFLVSVLIMPTETALEVSLGNTTIIFSLMCFTMKEGRIALSIVKFYIFFS